MSEELISHHSVLANVFKGKFASQILESLGWTPGKGLGKEENGRTSPLPIKANNNVEGVGYKEKSDQCMDHQTEFDAFLISLNGGINCTSGDKKFQNLETRSKEFKNRVHYCRFTRGKDLSSGSEKEIACILGKRNHMAENQVEEPVNFMTGKNMKEYFAQKMVKIKRKRKNDDEAQVMCTKTSGGEEETRFQMVGKESKDLKRKRSTTKKCKTEAEKHVSEKSDCSFKEDTAGTLSTGHAGSGKTEKTEGCKKTHVGSRKRSCSAALDREQHDAESEIEHQATDESNTTCKTLVDEHKLLGLNDMENASPRKKRRKVQIKRRTIDNSLVTEGNSAVNCAEEDTASNTVSQAGDTTDVRYGWTVKVNGKWVPVEHLINDVKAKNMFKGSNLFSIEGYPYY